MGSSPHTNLDFYLTPEHECSYLPDEDAMTLFADPSTNIDTLTYSELIRFGFRRSGTHVYRPRCPMCDACIPIRIPVERFKMSRSQRRNWKANADLQVTAVAAEFKLEHFELYQRYMHARHAGGGMDTDEQNKYIEFLINPYIDAIFYEFRDQGKLIAVAIVDKLDDALSAVYTYFDPDYSSRGLGVFAVLWQITQAQQMLKRHVYLGYWITNCQKMDYKDKYRPYEIFREGDWVEVLKK